MKFVSLLVTECLLLTGLDEQLLCPETDMREVMLSEDGSLRVRAWLWTSASEEPGKEKKSFYYFFKRLTYTK